MQDASPQRWAGAADIHGDDRAQSAAKLLNVGLTRGRRRLYVIGDWDFVSSPDRSPGMKALAALDGRENFRRIDAADLLRAAEALGVVPW